MAIDLMWHQGSSIPLGPLHSWGPLRGCRLGPLARLLLGVTASAFALRVHAGYLRVGIGRGLALVYMPVPTCSRVHVFVYM
jgi:hypothetical protein